MRTLVRMAYYDTAQLNKLNAAIEEEDWFTAIVLSATQLERHGCLETKEYLHSLKVNSQLIERLLDRKSLYQIANYLFAISKIDDKELTALKEINKERRKFVHRKEDEEFLRGAEAKEKYEPLSKEAIRILREKLKVVRLRISK